MLGGPSSGHDQNLVEMVHGEKGFKRSSPSPTKTFDEVRGASPEINSYNNIKQNLATDKEFPRLSVL